MNQQHFTYIGLCLVFIGSFLMTLFLPVEDIWKNISSVPAIGALIAVIYQILRDHSRYQQKKDLQQSNNNFSLGVTSHMAQVAFDKHVEFCEKYMAEVHETISTLWQEGPTKKAMTHGLNFHKLRVQYSTWVTEEITNKLTAFENTLFEIGSQTKLSESTKGEDTSRKAYDKADEAWMKVLGQVIDKEKSPDENIAIESIKNRIRDILGVQELTKIRELLIKKALNNINK